MASFSRPRHAFWGDIRFLIGVALVALSIGGVWLIVAASDDATPLLRATRTITQGEVLASDDFQVVEVGMGALADGYLAPEDLRSGQLAGRTIEKGEIVPVSALTDADRLRTTTIVIDSSNGIPEGVHTGTVVEVWQAPLLDDGRTYDTPRILATDVTVHHVQEPEGMLAESDPRLEIVIDRADVADVLAAVTGGAALSIVPVGAGS